MHRLDIRFFFHLMQSSLFIYRSSISCPKRCPLSLAIGNFDGVHLGHQAILRQVCNAANQRGLVPTVMTFEPHPRNYFASSRKSSVFAAKQIFGLRDKLGAFASCGIKQVILERFNHRFASVSGNEFIEKIIVASLNTRWLIVGEDFRFGCQRKGDITLLRKASKQHGFEVQISENITSNYGRRVSSSEIRLCLAHGNLDNAKSLLGSAYYISGHVVHGRKLGRVLGFPTMNLRISPRCAICFGTYVVSVDGLSVSPLPAVANLGKHPTINQDTCVLLEVHVLGKKIEAYGKIIRVNLLHRLRNEQKFSNLARLSSAIGKDKQKAYNYFSIHGL